MTILNEVWRPVSGYENLYQVSSLGRVRSCKSGRILKLRETNKGYFRAHLSKDGHAKDYSIHKLVATAFLPNPSCLNQVNHIDENKANNHVSNLQWCSCRQNINHGTCIERTHQKQRKKVVCVETGEIYSSVTDVWKKHGYPISFIASVCRGEKKTAYGFHWKYQED